LSLAVDIGGSKFVVGLVTPAGEILHAERHGWRELTPEGVARDIKEAIHGLLQAYPRCRPTVMGAAIPGLADPQRGLWVESGFSGIRNLPFGQIMEDEFGLPVSLDNDCNACAAAERTYGCCRDIDHFIWITVSNGIGGCIFINGAPYPGGGGNAGEIGHVVVEEGPGARPCACGHAGCAEMHAAGPALVKNYLSLGGAQRIDGEAPSAKNIDTLARRGDKTARAAYELEGLYLGRAIAAAVNLINPQKVVIGGGVSLGFDLFWPSLERTLRARVYWGANPNLKVEPTALGYNAALLGAAVLSFAGTPRPPGNDKNHEGD
jgi:glucokinase